MAKRVLMPVDRGATVEAAVPLVSDIARISGGTIRLLQVSPVPEPLLSQSGRVIVYADQEMARLEVEGLRYLRTVEARLDGVSVERVVRFGDPVEEILREAESFGADLIVMTTAKRNWLTRALFRSVAERLFWKARTAAMLLREA